MGRESESMSAVSRTVVLVRGFSGKRAQVLLKQLGEEWKEEQREELQGMW